MSSRKVRWAIKKSDGMKDIRMGYIFLRWDEKILGWDISFYGGTQHCSDGMTIIPMGCKDVPVGQ